jgi:hypothetical protein
MPVVIRKASVPRSPGSSIDGAAGRWVPQRVDYDAGVRVELLGVPATATLEDELVMYSLSPGRDLDLVDVEQISRRRTAE